MKLENKICVVTGGSRGIGKEISRVFLSEGSDVIIFDINEEEGIRTVEEFTKQFGKRKTIFMKADITDEISVNKKISDIYDEFGKHFLKISHWYYFNCPSKQELQPQTIEDISEVKWFKTKDIRKPVANTYATIKDILQSFFDTP